MGISEVRWSCRGRDRNGIPPWLDGGLTKSSYPFESCRPSRWPIKSLAPPCAARFLFRQGSARNSQENVLANEPFGGNRGITNTVNISEDNERELIDRAQSGEASAFEQLAKQHAARLWRCALALGKDGHWAEDLAQETLVEAWRCLARFDGRCQFSTWLYGILRHRFLKGRRHQSAARLSTTDALGHVPCTSRTPSSFRGGLRRCQADSPSGCELAGSASLGRRTAFLRRGDVG